MPTLLLLHSLILKSPHDTFMSNEALSYKLQQKNILSCHIKFNYKLVQRH